MQLRRLIAVAATVGGLTLAGTAFAGPFHAEAKLVSPAATSATTTIADANWRCDADACVGEAARRASLDNPVRECRKVVAVLGPVSAYTTQGVKLEGGDLKACNVAAGKGSASAAAK